MPDLAKAIVTPHALQQLTKRGITDVQVREVLDSPQQAIPVRAGRVVAQSILANRLLRVFVDIDREPPEVVTAYFTSKITK